LLAKTAALTITEAETATLASRLAALELQLTPAERAELDHVAGRPVRDLVRGLVDAVDPDTQAKAAAATTDPQGAIRDLLERAIEPLAANPDLRQRILELRTAHDKIIDEVSVDVLLDAHGVVDTDRARSIVESWRQYLDEHRNEITAIQLLGEAKERRISFADIQELADRISRPPRSWTPDLIWAAYASVETGRVRHSDRHTLTDLVSLLRFTLGTDDELVPYVERVRERYAAWLAQQEQAGSTFSPQERWWLDRMAEVVAVSAGISPEDLDGAPFTDRGGLDGAIHDLGNQAANLLDQLNEDLTA
jgi:type I restriction enzyme R subunit